MSITRTQLENFFRQGIDILRSLVSIHEATLCLIGLLFLKYLNDSAPSTEEVGNNKKVLGLILPLEAQWQYITQSGNEINDALRRAIVAFDMHPDNLIINNPLTSLGLLEFVSKVRQHRELRDLVHLVSQVDLSEVSSVDLAEGIDQLLEMSARAEGAKGGEFYTPSNLSLLMAELLDPKAGSTIYDPTCGTGSLLLAAYKQASRKAKNGSEVQLFGQEINLSTAALAQINMALHSVVSAQIAPGDTLLRPGFLNDRSLQQFDYVLSNPPIALRISQSITDQLNQDPYHRFHYGSVSNIADFAFLQHIVASLNATGRAVIAVGIRTLFVSGAEGAVREALIKADLVEAAIMLPANLLPNTSIPIAILILNKAKPKHLQGKVLFVHAHSEYQPEQRGKNIINEDNRRRIILAVHKSERQKGSTAVSTLKEIANQNYTLIPTRYIELIGIESFLGGRVTWKKLKDLADVFQGTRLQQRQSGITPIILGRDLTTSGLTIDELERVDVPNDLSAPVYTAHHDILIQRIGHNPTALLVDAHLVGVLVSDLVYVIRLKEEAKPLARYVTEFLNSSVGQALVSAQVGGVAAPTLRLTDLRQLSVALPENSVIELINNLHQVEQTLVSRVNHTRNLRQILFGIEDPEQVSAQLSKLNTEAQVLAASLTRLDDPYFQIQNFYPYVLAYPYRTLSAFIDPINLYPEQLRVAENILVFLGVSGLAVAAYSKVLNQTIQTNLTEYVLKKYWQGGISPGDWQEMAFRIGNLLPENPTSALIDSFASLWFKGTGRKKTSEFYNCTKSIVELKNDFKHDRGPKIPYQYQQKAQEMAKLIEQCLASLSFFVQYPMQLVQQIDIVWQTGKTQVDTLVYVGDHPGLKQGHFTLSKPLPISKLYLEVGKDAWIPLYPLISVHYCHSCQTRETYFIDRYDGPDKRIVLKSFERGHTHDNDDSAKAVGLHLEYWLATTFAGPTSIPEGDDE